MEFRKCEICEKLFASNGGLVCSDCLKKLDDIYIKARTAIRDHRGERVTVTGLAEMIKEDERYIEMLVKAERINLANREERQNTCSMCGAPLRVGEKYCDKCKSSLIDGFSGDSKGRDKNFAMHYQERRKR